MNNSLRLKMIKSYLEGISLYIKNNLEDERDAGRLMAYQDVLKYVNAIIKQD